jgi:hypothetical protein
MSLLGKAEKLAAQSGAAKVKPRIPPEDIDAVIGYKPRPLQAELERQEKRFNVETLHRRFGKTVMKVAKLVRRAAFCPFDNGRYAYLGPTYSQVEDIAWAYLQDYARRIYAELGLIEKEWMDRGKMAAFLPTRQGSTARIRLYGVDSPKQRLRGLYLDGAVFDEFAWIPWSVWTQQVRPMLSDDVRAGVDELGRINQWCDFIFTPAGRNHAYQIWRKAMTWAAGESLIEEDEATGEQVRTYRDDWWACRYKASETGILAQRELEDAFRDMGRSVFEQEYECSFDAMLEGAILAREVEEARQQGRIGVFPWNKLLPVHTAWDLGWDDATAIWFFQVVGRRVYVIDFYEAHGAGFDHYADVLAQKGYRYGKMYFPHDVEVHELGTGKSRASVLNSLGIRVTTVAKHNVLDGIAAMQALLPQCCFHEEATHEGLDRLALYRREKDESRGVLRQQPLHDWTSHAADAFRYLAMGVRLDRGDTGVPTPETTTHAVY